MTPSFKDARSCGLLPKRVKILKAARTSKKRSLDIASNRRITTISRVDLAGNRRVVDCGQMQCRPAGLELCPCKHPALIRVVRR
jgi:hypothetical protein